jgi:hypothetical protein
VDPTDDFQALMRRVRADGADHTLKLRETATGESLATLTGHTAAIASVAFGPDGLIVSAGEDGTVRLWDAAERKERGVLKGHGGPVRALALAPNGKAMATLGRDGTVLLWKTGASDPAHRLGGPSQSVAFAPGGRTLSTSGRDGKIRRWDAETGRELVVSQGPEGGAACLVVLPDGRGVVSAGPDRLVRFWRGGRSPD